MKQRTRLGRITKKQASQKSPKGEWERLGQILEGEDVASAMVDFARRNQITQIFLARPRDRVWLPMFGRDLVQRIVAGVNGDGESFQTDIPKALFEARVPPEWALCGIPNRKNRPLQFTEGKA